MARKKKEEIKWSHYQEAIFKYIGGASGHLVVEAAAGSGKTSTLVKSLEYIPLDKKILMTAFNRDIVSVLTKKTKGMENVDVMTLHGLGLSMLRRNFPTKTFIPEPFKYDSHIKNNIKFYTTINTYSLSGRNYFKYLDNIKKYVDFGRFYLCQTAKDLDFIEDRYGIDTIADEKQVAIKVMQWGKTELDSVDYTDMIWMPHVLFLKPIGLLYDFIMVDECQDMNKAERELILKCFKMGTRLVSVGDRNQCQPIGTKILLPDGSEKNIEELNVGDYVVTYNSDWGYYVGYKKYSVAGNISYQQCKKVTSIEHHTENEIITIETNGGMKSSYTPGHICYARINKELQKTAYCTYIMRNDDNLYRIGKTKLYRTTNSFSLNHRMISENCVDAWIIGIFNTEKEARICEIVNSYKFGIPQLVFDNERACGKRRTPYFMNEEIPHIYEMIGEDIEDRVKKCLEYNHKKIEFPIISKYVQNYISSNHFTTFRACNLFPEFMEVNTFNENNFKYKYKRKNDAEKSSKTILRTPDVIKSINYEKKECEVYSLDVEDLHNYVADRILTHNCLYSFAGADPESFDKILKIPNTECLPLSISYRCPKNVVEFAKKLVPSIEANEANTNNGFVKYDVPLSDVEDGDMILCRNNAPLVQVYNEFLKLGKKAFIRGKDIGANLKTLVKSIKQEKVNADCKQDGLFVRLYDDLFVTRNKIMERSAVDAKTAMTSPIIENKLDMIKALEILAEGTNTADELIAKIDEIFPKRDKKDGIALSTIHKAKGLEANNVYIACNSLMPSKSAKKDWELKQEHNLMYVAYTRAKNILGFIDEKDFKDFDLTNTSSQAKLDRIEAQVNRVLGKTTKTIINENTAKEIIDNAQKIDLKTIIPAKKTINISSGRTVNSFADLFKNKRQVKIKR